VCLRCLPKRLAETERDVVDAAEIGRTDQKTFQNDESEDQGVAEVDRRSAEVTFPPKTMEMPHFRQGCQMEYFQTKIPNLGKFCRILKFKMMVGIFLIILFIALSFGIFCGHLVHFMLIWYIFPGLGKLHQEKSGNPDFRCNPLY
jgi:hypothetical protein